MKVWLHIKRRKPPTIKTMIKNSIIKPKIFGFVLNKLGRQLTQLLTSRGHISVDNVIASTTLSHYTGIAEDFLWKYKADRVSISSEDRACLQPVTASTNPTAFNSVFRKHIPELFHLWGTHLWWVEHDSATKTLGINHIQQQVVSCVLMMLFHCLLWLWFTLLVNLVHTLALNRRSASTEEFRRAAEGEEIKWGQGQPGTWITGQQFCGSRQESRTAWRRLLPPAGGSANPPKKRRTQTLMRNWKSPVCLRSDYWE